VLIRRAIVDDVLPGNYKVKAGQDIMISVYNIHRSPEVLLHLNIVYDYNCFAYDCILEYCITVYSLVSYTEVLECIGPMGIVAHRGPCMLPLLYPF
jgi:hypothetical protein